MLEAIRAPHHRPVVRTWWDDAGPAMVTAHTGAVTPSWGHDSVACGPAVSASPRELARNALPTHTELEPAF